MNIRTSLIVLLVLPAGCFQAEAPRPAARAAGTELAARHAAAQPATDEAPTPALPELAATLEHGRDPAERREALYSIADIGEGVDVGLIGGALDDPDPGVRRAAVVALTGFGGEQPATLLVSALDDTDPRVRLYAVEALGQVGGTAAKQGLRQALGDPDPRVREAAREMLAEADQP